MVYQSTVCKIKEEEKEQHEEEEGCHPIVGPASSSRAIHEIQNKIRHQIEIPGMAPVPEGADLDVWGLPISD